MGPARGMTVRRVRDVMFVSASRTASPKECGSSASWRAGSASELLANSGLLVELLHDLDAEPGQGSECRARGVLRQRPVERRADRFQVRR